MTLKVIVDGPHPCWVRINGEHGVDINIQHTQLLALESAVAEAKRQVLHRLRRRDWHTVDPKLACPLETAP